MNHTVRGVQDEAVVVRAERLDMYPGSDREVVEIDDTLEILGVLPPGRMFPVECERGGSVRGDSVQVSRSEAVARKRWRDETHLVGPLSERRPDRLALENSIGVEVECGEGGPDSDASGACTDDDRVERFVFSGFIEIHC